MILGNLEIIEKSQDLVAQSVISSLLSTVAVSYQAEADIKIFWSCPILLELFTFCQIFFSGNLDLKQPK